MKVVDGLLEVELKETLVSLLQEDSQDDMVTRGGHSRFFHTHIASLAKMEGP